MKLKTQKQINSTMNKIEKEKLKIAKSRDILRKIYYDLSDILDSVEKGIDYLEDGKRSIEDAVDAFSSYV